MNKYRIIKEFSCEELNKRLTAREVISEIESLVPDSYDLPIICVKSKKSSEDCLIFDIEIEQPSIVILLDEAGRTIKSVHLFAK